MDSHPMKGRSWCGGKEAVLLDTSCYRNQDELHPCMSPGLNSCDLSHTSHTLCIGLILYGVPLNKELHSILFYHSSASNFCHCHTLWPVGTWYFRNLYVSAFLFVWQCAYIQTFILCPQLHFHITIQLARKSLKSWSLKIVEQSARESLNWLLQHLILSSTFESCRNGIKNALLWSISLPTPQFSWEICVLRNYLISNF